MTYIIFISITVILIVLAIILFSPPIQTGVKNKGFDKGLKEYNQRRKAEKEKNKIKIIEFLKDKEKITNNDVEKLLGVCDTTATEYLEELERESKIKQVGRTGSGVYYQAK